ncbi:MAG: Pr6Pr family membrane protein [Hyphomonadaceae bacterium]|nr:Pr6Pr family membrane protein [Hyphomonadaceae bacterium]
MPVLVLRALAAAAAPVILASVVSQGWISTQDMIRSGGDVADGVWRYLGYFTVLTNLLVVGVLAGAALAPDNRKGLNAPHIELMTLTSILFVGVVYHLLLASQWNPQGLQKLNDDVLHTWSPLAFAAFWLLRPRGAARWSDALFAAVWPTAYSAYSLTRGAFDGHYPYYFIDPSSMPWLIVARNMAGLVLAFVAGALALAALDQGLRKLGPQN